MSPGPGARRPKIFELAAARAFAEYRRSALTGFLRTRRAEVVPDPSWSVVDPNTARRVPGLRREELAWAAGVSLDYYTKLEQGRAAHPSPPVLESLAEVLQLDSLNRRYLHALASPEPAVHFEADPEAAAEAEAILRSLGTQVREPVMLHLLTHDLVMRSLDSSTLAVLFPDDQGSRAANSDISLLDYVFAEPISRSVYVDWSAKAREVVGLVHLSLATREPTTELLSTLASLWDSISAFRHLWSLYEPHEKGHGKWRLRLPEEGVVTCEFSTFRTPGCATVSLVIYRRAPITDPGRESHSPS